MKWTAIVGVLVLVLVMVSGLGGVRAAEGGRPNILFILADDLGRQDLGCEGSTFYETPHIDRIAREGVRFEYGYANCQVCSPSRASIFLGQFPSRHGITDWIGARTGTDWDRNDALLPAEYRRHLPHADTTLAEALKAGGYTTFFAGKWHLGGEGSFPEDHGFDTNVGGHHAGSPPGGYFSPYTNPKMESGPPGESLPIRLGDETARFIESHHRSKPGEPFFAFLSFYTPHGPIQTTRELWEKYRRKAEAAGVTPGRPAERFRNDRTLPVRQVQDNPVYAGMIEALDTAVGNVLGTIDRLGIEGETVVCFTSDNGGVSSGDAFATACLPFRGGKGRQWEGGIREPYYIKAPGVGVAGVTTTTPATGADFFPTLLELAGLEQAPAQHRDGRSLVPLLRDPEAGFPERALVWHYPHYGNQGGEPSSILTLHPWKLIHYYEDGRDELYNIAEDVGERQDRAAGEPGRVAAMRAALEAHLAETGAKKPQLDARYDPVRKKRQVHRTHTTTKANLEKRHAGYLAPDFVPNPTWWGSEPAE